MTDNPAGGGVPAAGVHGGDGPAVAKALGLDPASLLDLSQSLNPFAPDVSAIASGHLDSLGIYPRFTPGAIRGPVWRSDPHSPSGLLASEDDVADVWDEAFYPLATGRWSAGRAALGELLEQTDLERWRAVVAIRRVTENGLG